MLLQILLIYSLINLTVSVSKYPVLVVVSYDAFRYNYLNEETVPHMTRLRKAGTFADYLINVFPTKTFPNHHSIATGMYVENHGVVENSYFDPKVNKIINMSYEMFHYNENIVPIWRWNEDMGHGRHSGVIMWPGSSFSYQNKNVTYSKSYEPGYDYFKRIDLVMSWILDPKKPANLVMIYIEEPDTHGHAFGTNSEVVHNFLRHLDNVTQYLEQQIQRHGLTEKVNIVHLSDHGMANVTPQRLLNITQYLRHDTYKYAGTSTIAQLTPKPGLEADIYNRLFNASLLDDSHFKVYKKDRYPEKWHYKNNPRIAPILVMADEGYAMEDLISALPFYAKKYNLTITNESEFGVHGYENTVQDMLPFFMARGPKIKVDHKIPPFHTVDLFNLFCEILEIPHTKNNGTAANIRDILVGGTGKYSLSSILIITVGGVLVTLVLISCAAIITIVMIKRQQSITTTAALNKRFPQTFQTSVEAQHLLEPEEA